MKQLIIFDLDGTLAQSKAALDEEMAWLLEALLRVSKVAIISGGDWPQFEKQVLSKITAHANLSILPTCGTKYYQYTGEWKQLYAENFSPEEKKKILTQLNEVVEILHPAKIWGEQIEDRGSQITFSGLGQDAPHEVKKDWDPDFAKRKIIKEALDKTLPEFSIQMGGETSIDITKPGIDKAYGIHKLEQTLNMPVKDMLFIGDALFEGGNDHPARETGVDCIQVRDPHETKRVVEAIIYCLGGSLAQYAAR
ncbi:HAD-IIB family hydrolase [Chitinophaga sp. SYP-B3965]|uniref:HAD-IIB family hydrolase n=1 Tax=Chitinophaga sp. SYP-B3965 TaxID=2663120 RepID=UPI0012998F8C|nr:HAD-IIB family hydrolase [Chitinophaga sp. SYP-B3965]MRG47280.1 HAD-IIB family hydrolase [Chitinophaga sp. SYP-B3965]